MRYPSLTRSNMRYRGPMESKKVNKLNRDAAYDISDAFERLESLKQRTNEFYEQMRTGGSDMSNSLISTRSQSAYLKGGEARE
jgi:hypothetical protein